MPDPVTDRPGGGPDATPRNPRDDREARSDGWPLRAPWWAVAVACGCGGCLLVGAALVLAGTWFYAAVPSGAPRSARVSSATAATAGPASTTTHSATLSELAARRAFLERYVTFRRRYDTLDFRIEFHNGGEGGRITTPGPSDWDIVIAARVPAEEIPRWTAGLTRVEDEARTEALRPWVAACVRKSATSLPLEGVRMWYEGPWRSQATSPSHSAPRRYASSISPAHPHRAARGVVFCPWSAWSE